jgi:alkylhydroperoxidase family enzyme
VAWAGIEDMNEAIPRLELADMRADLATHLEPRVKRLGYLGELFKCAAHAPDVLLHFMRFTEALKEALPDRLTEVVALTVAGLMRNDYERNQHERLAVRLGFDRAWVAEVNRLRPEEAHLMSDAERAVQRYAIAAIETGGRNASEPFAVLARLLSPAEVIAVVLLVGRYVAHALAVNTLNLAPPVPSIFEDRFDG